MEKFDQNKWGSDDQMSGSGQARSYTCTFCNRGFSNARALGGHMNIHRRDRARIRQFSEENNNQFSSETNTNMIRSNIDPPFDINDNLNTILSEEKSESTTSFPLESLSENQNMKDPYEQATSSHRGKVFGGDEALRKIPFSAGESSDNVAQEKTTEELDLELRLGRERQDSSTKLGTREFF